MRRYPQVASRHVLVDRPRLDTNRQDVLLAEREAARIGTPPDPANRLRDTRHRHDLIADGKVLDWNLTAVDCDQRAAAIAGDRALGDDSAGIRPDAIG